MHKISTREKRLTPSAAAASSTPAGLLFRPNVPFLPDRAQTPAVIQRSSAGTGFPATGLEMLIEPESAPSAKVKGHDYSKTKAASPNLPLTEKMYWSIWTRYNLVIDSVVANPLTATIFTGSSLLKDLEVIQKTNITTGDFSKTHTLMVNWHTAAIRILPAGQTVPERKKLKIQLDEMLVLTNLMNDMGAAATKQSEKKTVKDTAMVVFYIGNSSDEAEAMVTVDRSDPSVPYIANFWGAPGSGSGKELLKALPSLLNVTTFRLHALNQDIADLYTKNYKGRPK